MKYHIAVIGLNHKTSSLELRESVSFSDLQVKDFLKSLKRFYPSHEFIILSTCNRVEMYIGNIKSESEVSKFISSFASYHNVSKEKLLPFLYVYTKERAIKHLFQVASGIDSLVIGEAQILGQIKKSYQRALELGVSGKSLNIAFQSAFGVAKKVRTLTKIGEGNVSISSISCQLAEEVLKGLSGRKILLIGVGKVGTLTLKSLHKRGADTVLVSSRNYKKALDLAKAFNGRAVRFDELEQFLITADIVITSTSAPHYIIHPDMIKRALDSRNNKAIFFIDLAVPRDIDPAVEQIAGAHLYNIDSLKSIAEQNMKRREAEISKSRQIIENEVEIFIKQDKIDFINQEDDKLLETVSSRSR